MMDYQQICTADFANFEIEVSAFDSLLHDDADIVDVREPGEMPAISGFSYQNIPLALIKEKAHTLRHKKIVLICQSGNRSRIAALQLKEIFGNSREIYSLKGGIIARQMLMHE